MKVPRRGLFRLFLCLYFWQVSYFLKRVTGVADEVSDVVLIWFTQDSKRNMCECA